GRGHERADAAAGEDAQPRRIRERLAAAGAELRKSRPSVRSRRTYGETLARNGLVRGVWSARTCANAGGAVARRQRRQHRQRAHLRHGLSPAALQPAQADQQEQVKRLVPVWALSLANEVGEQG